MQLTNKEDPGHDSARFMGDMSVGMLITRRDAGVSCKVACQYRPHMTRVSLRTIWKGYGRDDMSCIGDESRWNEAGRGRGEAMVGIGSCYGRGRGIMIQKCGEGGTGGLYMEGKAKTHSLEKRRDNGMEMERGRDDGSC